MINFTFSHKIENVELGSKITVVWEKDNEALCSKTAIVKGNVEAYVNQLARDCRKENASLFIDDSIMEEENEI